MEDGELGSWYLVEFQSWSISVNIKEQQQQQYCSFNKSTSNIYFPFYAEVTSCYEIIIKYTNMIVVANNFFKLDLKILASPIYPESRGLRPSS